LTENKASLPLTLAALILFFSGGFLEAQDLSRMPAGDPMDNLLFKVAVFGPSDDIFIWWGHAGLIVENLTTGYSRIYDWGIFSFSGDSFVRAYALNEIKYRCMVSPLSTDIENYIAEDRDIVIYTLDLESSKKEAILDYANNNIKPDNCWYVYHQFRDNCSTRIRDLVDMGTGGQFKEYFENAPGRFTFREHMRRFSWYSPFYDWFLGFLLGRGIDRDINMWEEMYLPVELGRDIADYSYIDDTGARRKLVSGVEIVNKTKNRTAVLEAPRSQIPRTLAAGLAIAALPALARLLRKKRPLAGRALMGISHSAAALALGIAGSVLFFASRVPERDYMRSNINLLFANPLVLAVIPLGIIAALGGKIVAGARFSLGAARCLRIWWRYVCVACVVSALINLLPFLRQDNWPTLALVLPIALVLALPERAV
jgi:hypothetical protein